MKVSVKDSAPCEKVLSITVSDDWIRQEYDDFFKQVGPNARVPGFRPGKAPRNVLETHYREEAREKVLERLISRSFREAVEEKRIDFLGRPTIRGVQFSNEKLAYEALLEVPPSIHLRKYKGLSAEKPKIEVKPEETNEALERVRESHAKFVAVEDRPSQMGDYLIADYRCEVEGKEVDQRVDDWFELREEEFLKGFSGQLTGARSGEERDVRIRFPENFGRKEWQSKEGVFHVKVKEVKSKKLLPLDDELAKETGEFATLADLRAHLEGQIAARRSHDVESEFESALFEALIRENSFEVPKGVVERRYEHLLDAMVQSLYRRGLRPEMIQKELANLEQKLKPEADRQVRISFLLDEIAKKEKLELTEANYEAKYKEAAIEHRQSEDAVRKYYTEHPEAKESLGIQILNESALAFVKQHAQVKEKS